jgi:opacity protein-like surface antigen
MKTTIQMTSVVAGGCVLLLAATAVRAQNSKFYFKADLGGNLTEDIDVKEYFGVNVAGGKMELSPGIRAGVGGGYQLTPWMAAEVELGYMANEIDSVTGATQIHDAAFANVPFLVNGKFQLPLGRCPVTPYLGAGVGFSEAIFNVEHMTIGNVTISGNGADTVFAWQVFAGVSYALNDRMGLGIEYRYFEADSPSWQADFTSQTASDTLKLGRVQTQSLSVLFHYRF